jgi:hypothetical protein
VRGPGDEIEAGEAFAEAFDLDPLPGAQVGQADGVAVASTIWRRRSDNRSAARRRACWASNCGSVTTISSRSRQRSGTTPGGPLNITCARSRLTLTSESSQRTVGLMRSLVSRLRLRICAEATWLAIDSLGAKSISPSPQRSSYSASATPAVRPAGGPKRNTSCTADPLRSWST